jgi:hypothetical protein
MHRKHERQISATEEALIRKSHVEPYWLIKQPITKLFSSGNINLLAPEFDI